MDGWKVMHQPARVAAPRDPPVQHICLHICLEEKCLIIVLNSCCSKSASARWADALTRRKLLVGFFGGDFFYLKEGLSFCLRCWWVEVAFYCQPSTLGLLIQICDSLHYCALSSLTCLISPASSTCLCLRPLLGVHNQLPSSPQSLHACPYVSSCPL